MRPLIGITQANRGDRASLWAARLALALAGGRSVVLTADQPGEATKLDGLMLSGGSDVHPHRFQAAPKSNYSYDLDREAMELAWLARAWKADLPTLGICRGAQLLNVAAGGDLHLDIAQAFPGAGYPTGWLRRSVFRKRVIVTPDSRLAEIVGAGDLSVNAFHSQAVSRVGTGLRVSAREANGAIQAIEAPSRRFWLGVQFHPELLIQHHRFRRIFEAFVQSARRSRTDDSSAG